MKLPKNFKKEQLERNWSEASTAYQPALKRARLLDATDRGKLWKAIQAKFPKYQVLPDTNHVAYVKSNLLASLYSIGRSASLAPRTEEDKQTIANLNVVLDHIWDTSMISYYQMQAGERAALLNLGVTQVGWDNSFIQGTNEYFAKGTLAIRNVDPMKFMRDPYSDDLDTAAYCMVWDEFHKNVILKNKQYKEEFQKYLDTNENVSKGATSTPQKLSDQPNKANKDYYKIVTHWLYHEGDMYEIHTVDSKHVLFSKEIKPAVFPFAELYCNLPAGDIIGTSEPSKIFANSTAYNLMNSIMLTSEVKNQKPPKFVNANSGINMRDFMRHGSDSDYTFTVNGDASKAVHYHEFPQVSQQMHSIMGALNMDIQQVSGVDGKYTGKDTGSLLTTGGVEQMLDQATLVDQPKIVNYERYTAQLTRLILSNLVEYGKKTKYFVTDPQTKEEKTIEVDFPKLKDTVFHYSANISPHLPKNKQRLSQLANVIMEKQMQYNQEGQQPVSLITPEEWLMFQDLPNMELMLERMGVERSKDYVDQVTKTIFQYANMLDGGMDPEDALLATAEALETGMPPDMPPAPPEQMQQGQQGPQMPPMPPMEEPGPML